MHRASCRGFALIVCTVLCAASFVWLLCRCLKERPCPECVEGPDRAGCVSVQWLTRQDKTRHLSMPPTHPHPSPPLPSPFNPPAHSDFVFLVLTSLARARVCRLCPLLGVGRMNATVLDGAYRIPERRGSRSQGEGARHAAYGRTGRDVDGGRHGHTHLDGTLLQGSPASFGGVGADDSTVRSREISRTCFCGAPLLCLCGLKTIDSSLDWTLAVTSRR